MPCPPGRRSSSTRRRWGSRRGEDLIDVELDSIGPGMLVADLIPNPPETRLLREAADRGAETLDGLGMLVEQGALAIEHWTGTEPDRAVMREALEEIFDA